MDQLLTSSLLFICVWYVSNTRFFFFFNDTATTEIYTLSLHDALPISSICSTGWSHDATIRSGGWMRELEVLVIGGGIGGDRKSTRLNSSHANISYAVFCLKQKNNLYAVFCLQKNITRPKFTMITYKLT